MTYLNKCGRKGLLLLLLLAEAALGDIPARAAELYAADGLEIRWDNTLRYSAGFRIASADPALLAGANYDDGDRDFAPGLISNRLDLMSEFDLSYGDIGVHGSVAAWYDTIYYARTDNNSPATYNPYSVPDTQFARAVRNLQGQYVDFGDAFAYGNFSIGGMPLSVRAGRQTLLWGESLFFDDNSIAAAQAPVDYNKTVSAPQAYSQNVFLPVDQISLTVQPVSNISLSLYYQFEWRSSRFPGVGSYFSYRDFLGAGDERFIIAPGAYLYHADDQTPPSGGQFGVSLHTTLDDIDFGFYALRYDAKSPLLQLEPSAGPPGLYGNAGEYDFVYPKGIELYGASFSTYLGDSNIAGEISARTHMALIGGAPIVTYTQGQTQSNYVEGDTLHAQLSSVTTLTPARLWDSADLSVEIAANDLLDVTRNASAPALLPSRFALNARALFEPHYFEVLSNIDVTIPFGVGYNIAGRSLTDYAQTAGAGDLEAGISATYLSVWKANLTLTSFLGSPYRQPLADRDFVAISIERTF